MNPSTRQARTMVAALLECGVDTVVVAPGSRNGPLSIALAQAAAAGRIDLHVRVDERDAAFLALGMARAARTPIAVLCTSGTATAHFYAAAYEATESGVPLVLLTADRPAEVRGKGANQTIDQADMFGNAVTFALDLETAGVAPDAHWRDVVLDAVRASRGSDLIPPGAVHLNIPFAEPLVPGDADTAWVADLPPVGALADRAVGRPHWDAFWPAGARAPRGAIVTSDALQADDAIAFARALGWPLLAEPGSGARVPDVAIANYLDAVIDPALAPDVVVTLGRFALSRPVAAFVKAAPVHIAVGRLPLDPLDTATGFLNRLPDTDGVAPAPAEWLAAWQRHDAAPPAPTRAAAYVAATLAEVQPGDLVFYGPSMTIRYAERQAPLFDDRVVSLINRGANGIDGVVSSALGAALAHQRRHPGTRAFALMGDLTFMHDIGGLFAPADAQQPDITFVVIDSDGGRIFRSLEQGAAEYAPVFDAVYGTPHGRDVAAIAAAFGVAAQRVDTPARLRAEVAATRTQSGISVIVYDDRESSA